MLRQFKKGERSPRRRRHRHILAAWSCSLTIDPYCFHIDDLQGRSISSLTVFPNKAKGYLLVLALPSLHEVVPSSAGKEAQYISGFPETAAAATMTSSMLKVYDLGSYR
jgi:hypothetical protein